MDEAQGEAPPRPKPWISAPRLLALVGLGMLLVSLPMDWGRACFIGCTDLQPLQRPFAGWLLAGVAATAIAILAQGARWAMTVLAVAGLACITFWIGISWLFLEEPTYPALVGTLGLLLAWSAPFARLGTPKAGSQGTA